MPHTFLPRWRVLACALALALPSFASQAVGLAELYRDALASDPQFAAAQAERKSADSLVTQARGQLLPQLGVNASRIRNDQTVESTVLGKRRENDYEFTARNASLNLSLAVFRPQAWVGLSQSWSQVDMAEAVLHSARQDLLLRLTQAYFDIQLAQDNLTLVREQKAAITEQLKQAKRYLESGIGTVTDINESQARYDIVLAQEVAAENGLEVKIRAIEQIVGKHHRQFFPLGNRLALDLPEPADIDAWLTVASDRNPLLKAREAALEVASKEVHKSMAAHLPTLDLVASRTLSRDPSYTNLDTDSSGKTLGLQLSIPIFSGGTTQGRVNQVSALREKALHELETTRRALNLNTRQEYLNVLNGVAQVKALEQAVKSNELALYSARRGQEVGLRTSFDVLNAQQLLFTAKRDLAQARYSYVLARLKLRAAAGLLDDDDVTLVDRWLDRPE